jgi:hypothetical protein
MSFGYATGEFEVTADRLGVYKPEEHIGMSRSMTDPALANSSGRQPSKINSVALQAIMNSHLHRKTTLITWMPESMIRVYEDRSGTMNWPLI